MTIDLATAPPAELATIDFRAMDRDLWADEAAIWARLQATLDRLPRDRWDAVISASEAGGPGWSARDHVAHLADWADEAIGYVSRVLDGVPWPTDEDYAGGDFDVFNESRRPSWAGDDRDEAIAHLAASRTRLPALARSLPPGMVRSDEAWSWIFMTLHGHVLEHLVTLERAAAGAASAG